MTFAGSPDRAEARLVPEAGYELDTFPIDGLPRRPSVAMVRALLLAGNAPRACRAILRRRRPDVVLGGGGYVAGPMVVAARSLGIPAALSEADAHLGLANRLAAPFAQRVFLAYAVHGRDGPKYAVVGRPIPARSRPIPRDEAREIFELDPDARILGVFGALAGAKALNDFVVDTWGEVGPAILHLTGRRDYDDVRRRVVRPRLPGARRNGALRRRAVGGRPRAVAVRVVGVGSRRRRQAGDLRAVPVRDRRPSGAERRAFRPRRRRDHGAGARPRRRSRARALAARRPGTLREHGRGDAPGGASRTPRSRSPTSCSVSRGERPFSGPAALVRRDRRRRAVRLRAARAGVGGRGRRLGPRAHAVPRAARRRAGRDLARAGRPGRLGGGRLVGVPGRSRDAPRRSCSASSSQRDARSSSRGRTARGRRRR